MRKKSGILLAGVMVGLFLFYTPNVGAGGGTYIIPTIGQIIGDWTVTLTGRSVSNMGTKSILQDRIVLVSENYQVDPYPSYNCYNVSGVIFDAADKKRQNVLGNGSLGFCTNGNYVWGWYSFFVDGHRETYSLSLFYLSDGRMEGIFNGYVWDGNAPTEFSAGTATLRN